MVTRIARRLEARDRRRAAIHEAGHFVVGRYFGYQNSFAVIGRAASKVTKEQTSWSGQHHLCEPVRRAKDGQLLGVAGAVAETVWQDSYADSSDFLLWGSESMSPSDWQICGREHEQIDEILLTAVEEVFRLFNRQNGELWSNLITTSRILIQTSSQHPNSDISVGYVGNIQVEIDSEGQ